MARAADLSGDLERRRLGGKVGEPCGWPRRAMGAAPLRRAQCSFTVLGLLLLAGAFAYQRLRPPPTPDMPTLHPSQR